MDTIQMTRLLRDTDLGRRTSKKLPYGDYTFTHRNSLAESLLHGESVTLSDSSVLKMLIDDIATFRADYDGRKQWADPEYGWGSYAEGKTVLARLTTLAGEVTYWLLDMYEDSWDNGYSDEWVHSSVKPVNWLGE